MNTTTLIIFTIAAILTTINAVISFQELARRRKARKARKAVLSIVEKAFTDVLIQDLIQSHLNDLHEAETTGDTQTAAEIRAHLRTDHGIENP